MRKAMAIEAVIGRRAAALDRYTRSCLEGRVVVVRTKANQYERRHSPKGVQEDGDNDRS